MITSELMARARTALEFNFFKVGDTPQDDVALYTDDSSRVFVKLQPHEIKKPFSHRIQTAKWINRAIWPSGLSMVFDAEWLDDRDAELRLANGDEVEIKPT